ncbi:MAG: hypothetical protein ACRCY4_04020 [Brevinema sp.]
MNIFFMILGIVLRFLLFFTLVRNITRNKQYGWEIRDYTGMGIIGLVLLWGWFSSYGMMQIAMTIFLLTTIVAAVFEGLYNRNAALVSAMVGVSCIILLFVL